jgi:multidrug efflux pump
MMGNGGMNNLQFLIETTDSYKNLYDLSNKLKSKIDESKKFSYVNLDLSLNDPYYDLKIDQVKMVKYGLAPAQISSLVQLFFSGIKTLEFLKDQERYRILLKTKSNPWNLSEIYIRSQDNKMVPLDNFVKLNQVVGANSLKHYNQMRNATISVQLNSDQNMPEAMKLINELAAEIIPIEYRTEWGGAAKFQNESSNTMLFLIMLSLVFIYAILAIQFESFISPMIIMFTAPLACCGALLLLKLSGQSLNIFTQVGIITLIGLITKHGILLVEFANQLVEQGVEIKEAIKHSAITRFRPILMTSGAMIFGSISLIIARGDGAEIRQAIGTVLVGGLGFGTILTLLIIPSLYLWVKKIKIS